MIDDVKYPEDSFIWVGGASCAGGGGGGAAGVLVLYARKTLTFSSTTISAIGGEGGDGDEDGQGATGDGGDGGSGGLVVYYYGKKSGTCTPTVNGGAGGSHSPTGGSDGATGTSGTNIDVVVRS